MPAFHSPDLLGLAFAGKGWEDGPIEGGASVTRFPAIEGARGWLAWAVVLAHCVQAADLQSHSGILYKVYNGANVSVWIFIIISGFVISHMIIEKNEKYVPYITRRFMRIFPLFAVSCFVGAFTFQLYPQTLSMVGWQTIGSATSFRDMVASQLDHPWLHALAHLTMLHGTINDALLPYSEYAFSPPAWSLSLEWQFYLVAPMVIAIAARPKAAILLTWLCSLGAYLFFRGTFGLYHSPSFLPGAAPLS
jgi:peptidoglycan/LPS O-acetylase OafA/YrhL